MMTRRQALERAAMAVACVMAGRSIAASQAKLTTVTLTIEGMT